MSIKLILTFSTILMLFSGCVPQARYTYTPPTAASQKKAMAEHMEKIYRDMGASELAIAIKTGNYPKTKRLVDSGEDILKVKQMTHENDAVQYTEALSLAIQAMISNPDDDKKKIVKLLLNKDAYKNSKTRSLYSDSTLNAYDKTGYLSSLFKAYREGKSLDNIVITKKQVESVDLKSLLQTPQLIKCIDGYLNDPTTEKSTDQNSPKIFPQQGITNAQSIQFGANGKLMFTVQMTGGTPLKLFDYTTGREVQSFNAKEFTYDYSSSNMIIASKNKKNILLGKTTRNEMSQVAQYKYTIYHIASKKVLGECRGAPQGIFKQNPIGEALSPDNKWLVEFDTKLNKSKYSTILKLVNWNNPEQIFSLKTFDKYLMGSKVVFSPDSSKLAVIPPLGYELVDGKLIYDKANKVFIWDTLSKRLIQNYDITFDTKNEKTVTVSSYVLDNEGNLYQSTFNGKNRIIAWENGHKRTLDKLGEVPYTASLAIAPDNRSLLLFKDSKLHEIDKKTGELVRKFINANHLNILLAADKLQIKSNQSTFTMDKDQLTIKNLKTAKSAIASDYMPWVANKKYTLYIKVKSTSNNVSLFSVRIYDTHTNSLIKEFTTTKMFATLSENGSKLLLSGFTYENQIMRSDYIMKSLPTFKTLWSDSVEGGIVTSGSSAFFSDATRYITGEQGDFFVRDSSTGKVIQKISNLQTETNQAFSISNDDKFIALWGKAGAGYKLLIYAMNQGRVNDLPLHSITFKKATNSIFDMSLMQTKLKFSSDNKHLYTYGSKISSINMKTGTVYDFEQSKALITQLVELDKQRLITSSKDAAVKVWNKKTGKELGSFSSFGKNEWVWVTPSGYFDSSKDGAKYLNVNIADSTLSIDQFYEQLYRPDLLYSTLNTNAKTPVTQKESNIMLASSTSIPPTLTMKTKLNSNTPQREQAFEIALRDEGGGIGRVEWRINGMLIGLDGEERSLKMKTSTPNKKSIELKRTLSLSPGENIIKVIAFNDSNEIASDPLTLKIILNDAISKKPALHVLAIGVNQYRDKSLRLNYAVADSKKLTQSLNKVGKNIFTKVNIVQLLDADVTKKKINETFKELSSKVNSNDVFIMYLAGHGVTLDAKYFFLPVDFRYKNEGSIKKSAIEQSDLQKWLSQIPAQKSLVLLDTCNSGGYVQAQAVTRGLSQKTAIDKLTRATGRATIAASSDTQVAYEGYKGQGVFTWAIIDALKNADALYGNKDGITTTNELSSHIDEVVPDITYKKWGYEQVPQANLHGRPFPIGVTLH